MKTISIILFIVTAILSGSCTGKNKAEDTTVMSENLISISSEQFETEKIVLGKPEKIQFDEIVKCNGNIITKPTGIAVISTTVPGIVKKINCIPGQKVYAGQILFELTGNEFIELQKEFSETASQLTRIRSEFERIKSLYSENVGTEKEMVLAESDYNVVNAKYSALKMKLNYIGLDVTNIEKGNFYESFSIVSPLNGYISLVNISVGQYTDQQTAMAEIIDATQLRLRIAVFEKDLGKLQENQKISFSMLSNAGKYYPATLKSIGINVENESKTIMCYADIDDLKSADFINNAYIEAIVITNNDTVTAVREESIIKSDGNNYLMSVVKNEGGVYYLKKVMVDIGRLNDGYIELLNQPEIGEIITQGGYNLMN